jgi:hypothetical protein
MSDVTLVDKPDMDCDAGVCVNSDTSGSDSDASDASNMFDPSTVPIPHYIHRVFWNDIDNIAQRQAITENYIQYMEVRYDGWNFILYSESLLQ